MEPSTSRTTWEGSPPGPPWFSDAGSFYWNRSGLSGGGGAQLGFVTRTGDADQEDALIADVYSAFINEYNYEVTFGHLSGGLNPGEITAVNASTGFTGGGDPILYIEISSSDAANLNLYMDIIRGSYPSNEQKFYITFGHAEEEAGGDIDPPAGETATFTVAGQLPPSYNYATDDADGSGTDHYSRSELNITNFFLASNQSSSIFFTNTTTRDAFLNGSTNLRFSNSVATWQVTPADCSVSGSNSVSFSAPSFLNQAGDQVPMTITLYT